MHQYSEKKEILAQMSMFFAKKKVFTNLKNLND